MMSSSETGHNPEDTEAAGKDLLSRDDIPDENQHIECFACGETMTGLFCHRCGQKNDNYRRSIWSLFSETFASIFSLENRMWRTWLKLLIKPGRVSREFADGKRTPWTSPVRIYLALSIILFGYMSLTETRIFSIRTDIVPKAGFTGDISQLDDSSVRLDPTVGFFRRQAELDRLNADVDFDRITRLMQGGPRQVFSFNQDLSQLGDLPSNALLKSSGSWPTEADLEAEENSVQALREAALKSYTQKVDKVVGQYNNLLFATENPDTIGKRLVEAETQNMPLDITEELRFESVTDLNRYTKESLLSIDGDLQTLGLSRSDIHSLPLETVIGFELDSDNGNIIGQLLSETDLQNLALQTLRNPAILNDGISRYLPRIMFLMMPFAAIIGLVFIRGRQTALLYDHLVHATYIHAVTFAFLLLLILISQWTPLGRMSRLFFIGMAIYLPLSTKTMFKRSWVKTLFASYSIALFYGLAMSIVVTTLTVNSLIQAAKIG